MKVAELEGAELDYWVVRALGLTNLEFGVFCHKDEAFFPTEEWSQGGPIIEREKICLIPKPNGKWQAHKVYYDDNDIVCDHNFYATEPLIAAMRCFVASVYGDEVSDE
jgi:hypothetical protein